YLCGSSVYCSDDTCSATPGKEPNRHYDPTGMCQPQGDYCPEYTSPFHNDCGCGCEQDVTCPPTIDCSPGPEPNPNCTEEALAQCPYSTRAL
ncbi:MAG TPA: hypothetical protein VNN72_17160, partial [Polyangiaceae bacterium]|nr:hypothetical protein [Polyangiaceae bacterium]